MENGRPETDGAPRPAYQIFRLAGFDEMWEQLEGLNKTGSVQEEFLETILEKAGTEVTGMGLSIILSQEIGEFVVSRQLPEVTGNLLLQEVPKYLGALIIDPEIREDSVNFWSEIIGGIKHEDSQRDPVPPKLPRKLKKALRKPPEGRTPLERSRVQAYHRRLGRGAVRR